MYSVIEEAKRRFKAYVSGDKSAISPSLRLAVFRTVIGEGGAAEVDAVLNEYRINPTADAKEICLSSLGRVHKPELVQRVLDLILSDEVKLQDKHSPAIALANNAKARGALWQWIKKNWEQLYSMLGGNMV